MCAALNDPFWRFAARAVVLTEAGGCAEDGVRVAMGHKVIFTPPCLFCRENHE
jgi:hypothetical protein